MSNLPRFVRVEDKPVFLRENKLRAVKFWWQNGAFIMGVVEDAPERKKGDADQE